jgi:hypothetical protein
MVGGLAGAFQSNKPAIGAAATLLGVVSIGLAAGFYTTDYLMCMAVPAGLIGIVSSLTGAAILLDSFAPTRKLLTTVAYLHQGAGRIFLLICLIIVSPLILAVLILTPIGWVGIPMIILYLWAIRQKR